MSASLLLLLLLLCFFFVLVSLAPAAPWLDSEAEFDATLRRWSSLPFQARRQLVVRHKAVWRRLQLARDELGFVLDWKYVDLAAAALPAQCGNVTAIGSARFELLDRAVRLARSRLDLLESRLKDAKRQAVTAAQTQLDDRMRAELRYMLAYAERVRGVPAFAPHFAYQRRLLDPAVRQEIADLLLSD